MSRLIYAAITSIDGHIEDEDRKFCIGVRAWCDPPAPPMMRLPKWLAEHEHSAAAIPGAARLQVFCFVALCRQPSTPSVLRKGSSLSDQATEGSYFQVFQAL
jgi:hypothetical protein